MDLLTSYQLIGIEAPIIARRSNLYHLKPVGIRTCDVESMTSYITRLAQAHSVSVRTFMVKIIFPNYEREYLLEHSLHRFWKEQTRALNGTVASAGDLVRILEILTQRNDLRFLTMLTWANVLPPRGLLRPKRAWC